MQALRSIANVVQCSAKTWRSIDFKCDTLSIKLTNSSPLTVRVDDNMNSKMPVSRLGITSSELVSASQKLRAELQKQQQQPRHFSAHKNSTNNENIQMQRNLASNPREFVNKSLPRLISRKRSRKPAGELSPNKTGLLLKQVDSLLEKVKSGGSASASEIDTSTAITSSTLNLRSMNVAFQDEIDYLEKHRLSGDSYPFYTPFRDTELILSMYDSAGSRDLVDTVCGVVNDMITACVTLHEKNSLVKKREVEKLTILKLKSPVNGSTYVMKPNVLGDNLAP